MVGTGSGVKALSRGLVHRFPGVLAYLAFLASRRSPRIDRKHGVPGGVAPGVGAGVPSPLWGAYSGRLMAHPDRS